MTSRPGVRLALVGAIAGFAALHNDFWLAHDGRLLAGLPVGLVYHVAYCVAAAGLMAVLVRVAWPGVTRRDRQR